MSKKVFIILIIVIFGLNLLAGCELHQRLANNNTTTGSGSGNDSVSNQIDGEDKEIDTSSQESHEEADDYQNYDEPINTITLSGKSASSKAQGVSVDDGEITIKEAGVYLIEGSLNDGQLIVDTDSKDTVKIIFNNITIKSSEASPFYVKQAEKVVVMLADGSENTLADASSYAEASTDDNEPNATMFSKSDLTIYSSDGAILNIKGNYNDGINSKDGLLIKNIDLNLEAEDDGIRGRDYVLIEEGNINIQAGDDGIKSDNDEDSSRGYINIEGGNISINSGGDAITAETDVTIASANLDLVSGGGSGNKYSGDDSLKGIKAGVDITINSGTINIDSSDDTLHSNGQLTINGGTFSLSSGDDGIHADSAVTINNGDIKINKSYEGIESAIITINDGDIYIVASDDGLNVAGGNDSSGFGRPGAGRFEEANDNYKLIINGGYTYVNANGDGLDSNGSVTMTGGYVVVDGPTNNGNGPTDWGSSFDISGGFLLAVGSSGMAQATSQSSTQNSVLVNFDSMQTAGTLVNIQSASGETILTYSPAKQFQSVLFSSSDIKTGETYSLYLGGQTSGTELNGVYSNGTYSPGTLNTTLSIESSVTTSGATGGMGGGMGGGMRGGGTPPDMDANFDPSTRTRPTR